MNHFFLILLLTAFPALSTDMYLPAIPQLCDLWGISLARANLSLAAFFISFSGFLLVHGPLADRHGRRPVLIGGVSIYLLACILCAVSPGIIVLVLARILQAFGASAASAMSLALAKDLYQGDARKKLLAYLGIIIPLCPMVAPSMGALLLQYFSWRGIFLIQAVLALPALYGCVTLRETVVPSATGGLGAALMRYVGLFRNKGYLLYAVAFSVVGFAFFGFIGGSSDIYIRGFGLSEYGFSLYFAFNALALMGGSMACAKWGTHVATDRILIFSLVGMTAGGVLLTVLDTGTPMAFALPMALYTFFMGMSRPISNHVILEQVDRDTGTAASLLTFFIFLVAGLAMELVSFDWPSKPVAIGVMAAAGAALPLVVVFFFRPRV
ncbi:MAG: Bcr/CflA family efflux MFS transporter [Pseudomonadota bacterium]